MKRQAMTTRNIGNARELGGYVNKDGKRIQYKRLFRSSPLHNLTEEDYNILKDEYNLRKVFDFRSFFERKDKPDDEIENCTNIWIPILEDRDPDDSFTAEDVAEFEKNPIKGLMKMAERGITFDMYTGMLKPEYSQRQFAKFIREVIDCKEGAVLWHCSAGKDRTGMGAILLLTMLDVDMDTILDDYMLTNEYRTKELQVLFDMAKAQNMPEELYPVLYPIEGVAKESLMQGINYITENYGSILNYIHEALGITDEEIAQLKENYLE